MDRDLYIIAVHIRSDLTHRHLGSVPHFAFFWSSRVTPAGLCLYPRPTQARELRPLSPSPPRHTTPWSSPTARVPPVLSGRRRPVGEALHAPPRLQFASHSSNPTHTPPTLRRTPLFGSYESLSKDLDDMMSRNCVLRGALDRCEPLFVIGVYSDLVRASPLLFGLCFV